MPTDSQLVRRAQAGDDDAFDELVNRHGRLVLSLARRITRNRTDAEDVAQEAFLRLHRSLARVDPERPLAPWLVRLTVNAARRYMTRRAEAPGGELTGEQADPGAADPGAELERVQFRAVIERAMAVLPRREREVFVLRDLEGLDTPLIAEALGLAEATVRRQSMEARRKVADWLRTHHPELLF